MSLSVASVAPPSGCAALAEAADCGLMAGQTLIISDPRAVRAMANPLRLVAVDELYRRQGPATATELADLVGLTPSAMSYHLRAVESTGLIRRGESTDARERPWVPAAPSYSLVASVESDAVQRMVLIDSRLMPVRQRMEELLAARSVRAPDADIVYMVMATGQLLLSPDEVGLLQERVQEVFDEFEALSADRSEEGDLRRARYMWSVVPERVHPED
ncbi:DNA-binding transcriptional ArsR family regulator [Microbacterium testaceum]|nr:DNA-binding transcriptional ArsR family regulator [Microbacterium testaceum]MDR6096842.1 DNA-binding transcriptional ArsR family regulator [Microbacterium sp. SORGH_AS_0454]